MELNNKNVCITGKLDKMDRFTAFNKIIAEGGIPKKNMNNTIDILIVADSVDHATVKIMNQNEHCQIINEQQFYNLIGA